MKVNIGPHPEWIGPYQIAEKLMFWEDKYDESFHHNEKIHKFGTWLAEDKHGNPSLLAKLCTWVHSKKKRKIKVHIENYDIWNMDHTLAHIALPMLKKLKVAKHGSPFVDDEDVPDELKSTAAPPKENEWDTDDNFHKRWEWVMDEMIHAFEREVDEHWEDAFWKSSPEIDWTEHPEDEGKPTKPLRWAKRGECDWDGLQAENQRIQNGFRLFGKYYSGLWD